MNDMAYSRIKLSADQRSRLRRAITSHDGWKALRTVHDYDSANMSTAQLFDAAALLEIDVAAAIAEPYGVHLNEYADQESANIAMGKVDDIKRDMAAENKQHMKWAEAPKANASADIDTAAAQIAAILGNLQPKAPALDLETVKRDVLAETVTVMEAWMQTERAKLTKQLDDAVASIGTVRVELKAHDGQVKQIAGTHHPQFATLMRVLSARQANGFTPSVWIAGPAGSGKTYAAHTAAKALDIAFHINGALSMAHELMGFIDAGGTYHTTPFRNAYEFGGVYLFDEVDGSDNSALLALNAALANGVCSFPDKCIERHHDCHIMAAANTWGIGATADYVGRAKIDAAFLSRFPVRLSWDYDTRLEQAICGNPDFAKRVQAARRKARNAGIKVLIDPRASIAGSALIAAGMTEDEAAQFTYLANLKPEERSKIEEA